MKSSDNTNPSTLSVSSLEYHNQHSVPESAEDIQYHEIYQKNVDEICD